MNNKLSVIIITKNEQENIKDCLESVKWANEIIIVDAYSIDGTVEIAKNYTDKIYVREWQGFANAKNYALQFVTNKWVFSIDADERITKELKDEINQLISLENNEYCGYMVARRSYFLGKWIKHCGWYPNYVTRLFQKEYGRYNNLNVHEQLIVDGKVGMLKNDLIHFTDKNLFHYFNKFNTYTSLAVEDLLNSKQKFSYKNLLINPIFTFFKMYFLKLGFLDGIHGLILCTLSSFYVFTKYAKLWEKSINNKEN
ncbi:MAG: hypothetical protein IGBAC_1759 [Ignavibacteriae bacterium]|nr:MAG: hypothetical protein IGBAC_1759 [Ignavibacteriota bacterium]